MTRDSAVESSARRVTDETFQLHRRALVFDALSLSYVLNEPYTSRLVEGGVDGFNVTIVTEEETWEETLALTREALEKIDRSPILTLARSAGEIRAAKEAGQVAVVLGTQGAGMLGPHIDRLDELHRLGFRFFAPAYTGASLFADGCGEYRDAGLSVLGRELIAKANDLGLIIDLSHCGHRSRWEAAELADHPACTHSNAFSVNENERNTKDETMQAIAAKGGVVGICALPRSVWPQDPTLEHLLDHLDYVLDLIGPESVGIGCDFTEAFQDAFAAGRQGELPPPPKWRELRPDVFGSSQDFYTVRYPAGLERVTLLPNLTQGMRDRGHSEETVAAVLGENWLRQLEAAAA